MDKIQIIPFFLPEGADSIDIDSHGKDMIVLRSQVLKKHSLENKGWYFKGEKVTAEMVEWSSALLANTKIEEGIKLAKEGLGFKKQQVITKTKKQPTINRNQNIKTMLFRKK